MKNIKKRIILFVICIISIFLISCKSNKKENSIKYYDVYSDSITDDVPIYYLFGKIYYRFSSVKSYEQKVLVYYGIDKDSLRYVSNYSKLDDNVKFNLYRECANDKVLLDSYVKPLRWFLSEEFIYSQSSNCKNMYEDTIAFDELKLEVGEYDLSYSFELKPIDDKKYLDLYCYETALDQMSSNDDFSYVYTMEEAIVEARKQLDNSLYNNCGISVTENNKNYIIPFHSVFLRITVIKTNYNPIFKLIVDENNEVYFKLNSDIINT